MTFILEDSSSSRVVLLLASARSFSSARIRFEILHICNLAARPASFLILSLNCCHRVCALEVLSSGARDLSCSCSSRPRVWTIWFKGLSCRRPGGHDHRPFPMNGVYWGAKRTSTILWSDGISEGSVFQSLRHFPVSGFA